MTQNDIVKLLSLLQLILNGHRSVTQVYFLYSSLILYFDAAMSKPSPGIKHKNSGFCAWTNTDLSFCRGWEDSQAPVAQGQQTKPISVMPKHCSRAPGYKCRVNSVLAFKQTGETCQYWSLWPTGAEETWMKVATRCGKVKSYVGKQMEEHQHTLKQRLLQYKSVKGSPCSWPLIIWLV